MACLKLGSKPDGFQRKGQAWFCTSGLPSDVVIEVEEMSFHLHKFPLVSRSRKLAQLTAEHLAKEDMVHLHLPDMPGGPDAFELAAKFCYGVKFELTAANVVPLRCAAEYLEMTEEFGEANLLAVTERFLNQIVLRNWKECVRTLQSCETVFLKAEELGIVNECVDALTLKACTDPNLLGWPMPNSSMQSPGGSFLWNGISTGARPKRPRSDWWYEDISMLSLPLFKRVIGAMELRGIKPENIAGALMHFARRYLPALSKWRSAKEGGSGRFASLSLSAVLSEDEQKVVLETVESLLPMQKGLVSTKFLSGLLRSSIILNASPDCRSNIERRIGLQLDQAKLEDLLLPNLAYNLETLYDIDCVQRILDHFLLLDQSAGPLSSPSSDDDGRMASSPSLTPMMMVARLMDGYLGEVAPDVNLKPSKFQSLAEACPDFARVSDDGLYRAIDIYLKAHPWLKEEEREQLCRLMDCQKLSLEACSHAAQNERLPLRAIVQVLFFEQLQLRTAIASCFMVSDNSRPLRNQSASEAVPAAALRGEGWANAIRDNQALKVDMDHMKLRVSDLERECTGMREELEKIGKVQGQGNLVSKTLGGRFKSHICRTREGAVEDQTRVGGNTRDRPSRHSRQSNHHRSASLS
eukprot:c23112_g1_i1 orf=39-1952(+)